MKKFNRFIFTLLSVAILATPAVASQTIYLDANGIWDVDNAKFVIHSWGSGDNDAVLTLVSGHIFKADIPDGQTGLLFKRLSPSCTNYATWCNREGYWGKTLDQTIVSGKNLCKITGWTDEEEDWCGDQSEAKVGVATCEWGVYGNSGSGDNPGGNDPITPGQDFSTAVPSQCTDVMLQAFYWLSNTDNTYGTSKWPVLQSQASEISQYFQLVWLPPSSLASDNYMGYIPVKYHEQNGKMGSSSELNSLISALHNGGTRVLADVVINHAGNKSSWVDYWLQDFGSYGRFQPNSTWITSDDEAKGKGTLSTNADDGQESNKNYGAARDWDHKKTDVQEMCKAYLKYLKGTMKYDGYRFDYCVGYHVSHINDYVSAAKPYISVMEYWNGNASTLKTRIDQASKNTMTFDFALFHNAIQKGIATGTYSYLTNGGLRAQGYQKYAVTFVDNHDTFNRSESADCGNKSDGSSINNKELIMQCNAYILSMPGIPCVFYPHWYKYKSDIKAMITARRNAGIHSESTVSETSGSGYYEATVTGKYGKVILYLGSSASKSAPEGYKQAVKGTKYAMYYTGTMPAEIEQVEVAKPELDKSATMYNIMGQQVDATYKGIVIQNGYKYLLQ